MSETIIVFVIAGIALALSVRWFYRTVAEGKSEGCGCSESSCPTISSCDTNNSSDHCKEI